MIKEVDVEMSDDGVKEVNMYLDGEVKVMMFDVFCFND